MPRETRPHEGTVRCVKTKMIVALVVPVVWSVVWIGFLGDQIFGSDKTDGVTLWEGLLNLSAFPGFLVVLAVVGVGGARLCMRGLLVLELKIGRGTVMALHVVAIVVMLTLSALWR